MPGPTRFLLIAVVVLATFVANAHGGGLLFDVDSTGDESDALPGDGFCQASNGKCTLRAAIQEANSTAASDGIEFAIPTSDPGYDPNSKRHTIRLLNALPAITQGVEIIGPGSDRLTVVRSHPAGIRFRIFNIVTTATVTLYGMTITNGDVTNLGSPNDMGGGVQKDSTGTLNIIGCLLIGNSANYGGALAGHGHMVLTDSQVISNMATNGGGCVGAEGGGIYNRGTLVVSHSLIENNQAGYFGGGILNHFTRVEIINSLIAGNWCYEAGAGLFNRGGEYMNITNSTISDNVVDGPGDCIGHAEAGGIYNNGTLNIINSTVARNSARYSGGIENNGSFGDGLANIKSTLVASNTATVANPDVHGTFTSQGFNLVRNMAGGSGFNAVTDINGVDPLLDPDGLAYNGGPVGSIALLSGSPARDKGVSNGLTTDQRGTGYARTVDSLTIGNPAGGDGTDIGAWEFGAHFDAFSRKKHGATNFNVPLPVLNPYFAGAVECRSGGATGDHRVVATFPSNVTLTNAKLMAGTGTVSAFSANGANITVDLTGIPAADGILLKLFGVSDGTNTNNILIPLVFLLGDANGDYTVNSADISLTKSKSGQSVDSTNFREDLNVDGLINSADISLVKSRSGTQ